MKEENVGKFNFLGKAIAHASAGAAVLIGIAVMAVGGSLSYRGRRYD